MVIELNSEDHARLAALAHAQQRSEPEVASGLLHQMLDLQASDEAAVRAADEQIARGEFLSHEDAVALFADVLRDA